MAAFRKILVIGLVMAFVSQVAHARRCEESYIPPNSGWDDLIELSDWARGVAFVGGAAKRANVVFDKEAYMSENPNVELYNFAQATLDTCLQMNPLVGLVSQTVAFINYKSEEETFQEYYLKLAVKYGLDGYILEVGPDLELEEPVKVASRLGH